MNKLNTFFYYFLGVLKVIVAFIPVVLFGYLTYFFCTDVDFGFGVSLLIAFIISFPVFILCSLLLETYDNRVITEDNNASAANIALGYVAYQQQVNHRNL
ncbi:hypothetical protein [Actinobacillus porcinus]|uniref:hypothetical protein n=1 Tax=Actinobacillus porcinus TaxID=51048 RepID=UPI00235668CA|nr:hypothetical protein [Actinobacillus porcinus]